MRQPLDFLDRRAHMDHAARRQKGIRKAPEAHSCSENSFRRAEPGTPACRHSSARCGLDLASRSSASFPRSAWERTSGRSASRMLHNVQRFRAG